MALTLSLSSNQTRAYSNHSESNIENQHSFLFQLPKRIVSSFLPTADVWKLTGNFEKFIYSLCFYSLHLQNGVSCIVPHVRICVRWGLAGNWLQNMLQMDVLWRDA